MPPKTKINLLLSYDGTSKNMISVETNMNILPPIKTHIYYQDVCFIVNQIVFTVEEGTYSVYANKFPL